MSSIRRLRREAEDLPDVEREQEPASAPTHGKRSDLTLADRRTGFVRPLRRLHMHVACRTQVLMGIEAATMLAYDPQSIEILFCAACDRCFPAVQFVWTPDYEPIGMDLRNTRCRVCGCSQDNACLDIDDDPCRWIEPDLCSCCKTGVWVGLRPPVTGPR